MYWVTIAFRSGRQQTYTYATALERALVIISATAAGATIVEQGEHHEAEEEQTDVNQA